MTQKDKELLLKDLTARLPYGVKVQDELGRVNKLTIGNADLIRLFYNDFSIYGEKALSLPLLRPLSSMTEEEREYIEDKCAFTTIGPIGGNFGLIMPVIAAEWLIDFYNSHHLDWRGLIPMGLALEAPEGVYNIKEK